MKDKLYREIAAHYEHCLDQYGDSHKGVDWPNPKDADTRYRIMLELIPAGDKGTLLDFGCGTAQLYTFLQENLANRYSGIEYSGLDISPAFVEVCRKKYPQVPFLLADILEDPDAVPDFDYFILNGVFTEKLNLSFDDMERFFQNMLMRVFAKARKGVAFNVMSKAVDWERDDLFHLSADRLITFLTKRLSRHFIIRNDYGLYEYTTYIYKQPCTWGGV